MTSRFHAFVVLMVVAAAVGLGYQRPLLIALAESGFIGLLLVFLYGSVAARGIRIQRNVNARVVEEDEVAVQLWIGSTSRLPIYAIEVTDWFTPEDDAEKKLLIESVSPCSPTPAVYVGHCSRGRGLYELGPMSVSVADPLGFFVRERRFEEPSQILVLPRTLPVHPLELSGLRSHVGAASENMTRAGSSPLFFGTREYRSGDNMRHIHWRSSARWGRLVLKEFEAISNREVSLFVDLERNSGKGVLGQQNVELAIHLAASLAEYCTQNGLPVQLLGQAGQDVHVPLGTGQAHLSVMMETLATVVADGTVPYSDLILSRAPLFPEGSTAVLILNHLDYEPATLAACVATLARRQGRVIVFVIDDSRYVRFRPRDPAYSERLMRNLEDTLTTARATVFPIRAHIPLPKIFSPEHEIRV